MSDSRSDFDKKRAARRKRIRKRRIILGFVFFLIVAVAVFVVLSMTVFFPIKTVTAKGSKIYSESQIKKASGINDSCNLFALSKKDVEDNLHRILPYVDTVTLKRKLPDTVNITVTDAKEYACWLLDGKYYAISESGYVLNCYDSQPENTFVMVCNNIECKIGTKAVYKDDYSENMIDELKNGLSSHDIKINSIDITNEYDIKITVDDRFEVHFGDKSNLDRKIAHLESMIKNIGDGRGGKIDLSMWSPDKTQGSFTEKTAE